jgi:hypothetical protein
MATVLILCREADNPDGLIHIALSMIGAPFNYSLVCDALRRNMRTVNHRKGYVPTCLQCIATLQNRYWNESFQ